MPLDEPLPPMPLTYGGGLPVPRSNPIGPSAMQVPAPLEAEVLRQLAENERQAKIQQTIQAVMARAKKK